jgi:hypothetical protein
MRIITFVSTRRLLVPLMQGGSAVNSTQVKILPHP